MSNSSDTAAVKRGAFFRNVALTEGRAKNLTPAQRQAARRERFRLGGKETFTVTVDSAYAEIFRANALRAGLTQSEYMNELLDGWYRAQEGTLHSVATIAIRRAAEGCAPAPVDGVPK